jgi:hypothetical protein
MSEQTYFTKTVDENSFWENATKYTATKNNDESFVNEIAYMMVTLHRTGA